MKRAFLFLAGYTGLSLILHFLLGQESPSLLKIAAFAFLAGISFFPFRKILTSFTFLALLLGLIGIVVAISTFSASSTIYSAFWFNALLLLLAVSLLSCVLTFRFRGLRYYSYLLMHLGLLVVAVGFIISGIGGGKCYLSLFKGKKTAACQVMKGVKITSEMTRLPFQVELLDFKVEYYRPKKVILVYKRKGEEYRVVKSLPAEKGKKLNLGGLKVKVLEMKEGVPVKAVKKIGIAQLDGGKLELPEGKVVTVGKEGYAFLAGEKFVPHLLIVRTKKGLSFYVIAPGHEIVIEDKLLLKALNFYPDFKYSVREKRAYSASDQPNNPALEVMVNYRGSVEKTYLFSRAESSLTYGDMVILYRYLPRNNLKLLQPSSVKKEEVVLASSTRVIIEVNGEKKELLLNDEPVLTGDFLLAFKEAPREAKEFESLVRLYGPSSQMEARLKVNSPFSFMGYKLYQSDYDPNNPDFSGILVVKEPGEPVLYVGFVLILVGTVLNLIYRRKQWAS